MENNKLNDLVNSLNLQEFSFREELAEMPSASEPTLYLLPRLNRRHIAMWRNISLGIELKPM